ncbi:Alpha/Beta hydrolase protein [Leptodontidium sp. 2 PMI_412]|nr:Alpha/Beta hydrolase protein [Leptodontidium sp. 2 PMI_412]
MLPSIRSSTARVLRGPTHQGPPTPQKSFHKDYNAVLEDQTCRLSDGRTVGFAEYGNLSGTPAFFFHGAPGSRYDGVVFNALAKKLNIRMICPDRPGHGLSTFQPGRKLGDYPKDISELAKQLGIGQYHVAGLSGGGPYAISCAHGSPKNELLNSAVIAGIGPPEVLTVRKAGLYTVVALGINKWLPSIPRYAMIWTQKDNRRIEKSLDMHYKYMTDEDRVFIKPAKDRPVLMAILKAAYAQGADGAIMDAQIYGTKWDFELSDVQKSVWLFYGGKDDRTPLVFGRYLQANLPKAELVEFPDASHWTIDRHYEEIWTNILGSGFPRKEAARSL